MIVYEDVNTLPKVSTVVYEVDNLIIDDELVEVDDIEVLVVNEAEDIHEVTRPTWQSPTRKVQAEFGFPIDDGDGLSFDEWRDYGVAGDDYEGPLMFNDDQFEDELEMGDDAFVLIGKEESPNSEIPEAMFLILCPGEHEELRRQVEEFVSKGYIGKIMSTCAQPRRPLDLMSFHVSGSVPKKVKDFVEGFPYHGDSSDDLVGNSRTNFVYPWRNDEGPSIEE
uniref:Reverse transcriptase domain-containing protein n=1 Tax=Tanacetum cinerariifolium TaxID=118510 RepID=A0A699HZJ7_TANCI|nr:hypothetical protein [Tanacetum cinerariifolium]